MRSLFTGAAEATSCGERRCRGTTGIGSETAVAPIILSLTGRAPGARDERPGKPVDAQAYSSLRRPESVLPKIPASSIPAAMSKVIRIHWLMLADTILRYSCLNKSATC